MTSAKQYLAVGVMFLLIGLGMGSCMMMERIGQAEVIKAQRQQ